MHKDSQTDLKTADIGSHETLLLLETYITEYELITLRDTKFAHTSNRNKESIILNTVVERIENSTHYYKDNIKKDYKTYVCRCPITDREMEILNKANKNMNPKSSGAIINKIQNSLEPVDKMYEIDIYIPVEFKDYFTRQNKNCLTMLAQNSTFILNHVDVNPKYKLSTYITQKEYNSLIELSNKNSIKDDIREFLRVIPQIAKRFNIDEEREKYSNKIN